MSKGEIIKMDLDGTGNKQYRVLSINDKIAKVFGMSDISTLQLWYEDGSAVNTTIGGYAVPKYQDSELDTYLNTTWYNTLSFEAKSAIVPQTIVQDAWVSTDLDITDDRVGTETVGERNIYALSVQDIVNYLNVSPSNITNVNICKMFWNTETQQAGENFWLRSAGTEDGDYVYNVTTNGYIVLTNTANELGARPAFTIDLSKISYTRE